VQIEKRQLVFHFDAAAVRSAAGHSHYMRSLARSQSINRASLFFINSIVNAEIYVCVCLLSANYSSIDLNYENQLQVNLPGSARSSSLQAHIKSLLAASKSESHEKSGEKFIQGLPRAHLHKFLCARQVQKKTSD